MDILTVPKTDKGYSLSFIVTDDDGVVIDLSDYTVTLKIWKPGVPDTLIVTGTCVVDSAADGTCHFVITTATTATEGIYLGELELTASGIISSQRPFVLRIKESG